MNADTFQLPEGVNLLDVLHRVDHKTPQHLNVQVLNTNNVPCNIGKNMPIVSMHPVEKCEKVQEVSWSSLQCDTSKLLPQILQNTSLQLEPDTKSLASSIPDVDILKVKLLKYHEFVDHEIKPLEEAGITSQSMSDWVSPILVVPMNKTTWKPTSLKAVSICSCALTTES